MGLKATTKLRGYVFYFYTENMDTAEQAMVLLGYDRKDYELVAFDEGNEKGKRIVPSLQPHCHAYEFISPIQNRFKGSYFFCAVNKEQARVLANRFVESHNKQCSCHIELLGGREIKMTRPRFVFLFNVKMNLLLKEIENMYIEIQDFGDFDMRQTKTILQSTKYTEADISRLLNEFYTVNHLETQGVLETETITAIPSVIDGGISRLQNSSEYTDMFITFLKKKGFTQLKTKKIIFSD